MHPTIIKDPPVTDWIITCSDGITMCDIISGIVYVRFNHQIK